MLALNPNWEIIWQYYKKNKEMQKNRDNFRYLYLVGRDGFEPSKTESADLQSAPIGRSGTYPQ